MNPPPKASKIAVVGLGYVGLPLLVAFAKYYPNVVGFDIDESKISELKRGIDRTGEISTAELGALKVTLSADPSILTGSDYFIVTVPTPIDIHRTPDLEAMIKASESVGKQLKKGAVVIYESTVYPGVSEEICAPILTRHSGLKREEFKVAYSPERINPGDREHTFVNVVKVVAGEDEETLEKVASLYSAVVKAGVFRATSIKVAEAAKVIENTQRDLNIALMNELALIFDLIGIETRDVLAAAGTKWNFLKFVPGLVGGHCIGVDPYYLTTKAEELGYHPQVILAGRKINDDMGAYLGRRLIKLMVNAEIPVKGAHVGILGLTFKENVSDLRNSRVPDIVRELRDFGIDPLVHDPLASAHDAEEEYGITLVPWERMKSLDALVIGVAHKFYLDQRDALFGCLKRGGVMMDIKSVISREEVPSGMTYWSL